MRKPLLLILAGFMVLTSCHSPKSEHKGTPNLQSGLEIYTDNPFYWSYNDRPTFLIGGSVEDNLFQINYLESHLDLLRDHGGNYLRCTMSSRDPGNAKPYSLKDGRYDLDHPNPVYWEKLDDFLRMTFERNIIIQVELWATYDFYHGEHGWTENVFNPANNHNYTPEESGLPAEIDHTAQLKINPFFATVPGLADNRTVLPYQQAFIDRIMSHTLPYNHVLYCIDNETNARPEWGAYWARYIRKKAEEEGRTIYITEMWDNWDPTGGAVTGVRHQEPETHPFLGRSRVANTIDAPDLYDFVDIANNNAQNGEIHYQSGLFVRRRILKTGIPRPINNVKVYGGTIYEEYTRDWAGSFKDGEERFWRNAFAGHASIRFHRPPYGHGLSPLAQHHILSMRMFTDSLDFFQHVPSNALLSEREDNEAFCMAAAGTEYALYFPAAGKVRLEATPGKYAIRWLHIRSSTWRNPSEVVNPEIIQTPDNDQWAVILKRNN